MALHPRQVSWFEAEIPRNQTVFALESLAAGGRVELEEKGYQTSPCIDIDIIREQLRKFDEFCASHADELPPAETSPEKRLLDPEELAFSIVETLRKWATALVGTRRRIRQQELEIDELSLLQECLAAMGEDAEQLEQVTHPSDLLYKQIFTCPHGNLQKETRQEKDLFTTLYRGKSHDFWLVIGDPNRKEIVDACAFFDECNSLKIPDWLPNTGPGQIEAIGTRLRLARTEKEKLVTQLADLRNSKEVRSALGYARLLRWYLEVFIEKTGDHASCKLTGWTTALSPDELEQQLRSEGIDSRFVFTPPRTDLTPPVELHTTGWSRPFRFFVDLMGSPGRDEIDPAPIVAVLVPFLFGFMFPDVGHGLVLAVAGWLLGRRYPPARILIACGLVATAFGFLFGEVFGIHGLIPSPFGHPLDNPVTILVITLLLGAAIILLGQLFSGIEAWWRADFRAWLLESAPILLLYASALIALLFPLAWYVSALALAWYITGSIMLCGNGGGSCIGRQLGHLVESSFQLAVATLSFVRVGAFALAHATFSVVIGELVGLVDSPVATALIFIAGHLVVIVLEGLVVMVQTTRLVLFEFFTRFLRFEGRVYKPLRHRNGSHPE
ncbi:MAG: V-type ATPase 116kDa subunit family protein [Sedimenticolaceae bacterium]|nr:V-type ATPase 116kDa subunit family protein [Sedimenticolaceae bacterium]